VFARRFAADGERGWVAWSIAAPVAVLAADAIGLGTADFRVVLIGQSIGAVWATSVYLKLLLAR